MSDTTIDKAGKVTVNEAGGDQTRAGRDLYVTHNHIVAPDTFKPPRPTSPELLFLPYLLDRRAQEEAIVDAVMAHRDMTRPLLCVIQGGEKDCCGDRFMQRIALVLGKYPKTKAQFAGGYKDSFIQTTDFKNAEQLHRRIQRSLGNNFLNDQTVDLSAVSKAFTQEDRPILLYATLSTHECNVAGAETLRHFADFWQNNFQASPNHRHLILVCLFFYHEPQPKTWRSLFGKSDTNQKVARLLQSLSDCLVLEKLELINKNHVIEWGNSDKVRQFFGRAIADEINQKLEADLKQHPEGLPLSDLALTLTPLLKQLAQEVSR